MRNFQLKIYTRKWTFFYEAVQQAFVWTPMACDFKNKMDLYFQAKSQLKV